jgi:hypothetical protein
MVQHCGQWSRPPAGLMRGVRPNSPVANTRGAIGGESRPSEEVSQNQKAPLLTPENKDKSQ